MIVFRDLLVDLLRLLGIDLLDELCRYARIDTAWLDNCLAQDNRTCRYDGTLSNDCVVENDGAHANERAVADLGAVDRYVMTDRHVVANLDGRFLIQGMKNGPILDIDSVTDANGVDIAAENGVEPNAATLADLNVTDDGGVVRKERVFANFRCEASY